MSCDNPSEDFGAWECWTALPFSAKERLRKGYRTRPKKERSHWLAEELATAFNEHMADMWDSMEQEPTDEDIIEWRLRHD